MNLPTHPEFPARTLAGFCAALLLATATHAAETITANAPPANPEAQGGQSLGQAAEDPTASLMSVQLADWYTARFHGLSDEDANNVVLRSAIPFNTADLNHIFRVTVPFITDSPSLDAGLSDMTFTYDYEAGRWASLPLGAKAAKLVTFGKLPVQFSLQYEHDFADQRGTPEDTIRFAMKFLFPTR